MTSKITCNKCESTNCEITGTTTDIRFVCKCCSYEVVKGCNDCRPDYVSLNERITWAIFLGVAIGFVAGMLVGICLI